jgi:hypothetical protein
MNSAVHRIYASLASLRIRTFSFICNLGTSEGQHVLATPRAFSSSIIAVRNAAFISLFFTFEHLEAA